MVLEEPERAPRDEMAAAPTRREYLRKLFTSLRVVGSRGRFKAPLMRCCKLVNSAAPQDAQEEPCESCNDEKNAQLLGLPKHPLERYNPPRKKTLVLDLDETLVHSSFENNGGHDVMLTLKGDQKKKVVFVNLRPFAREFIAATTRMFEVVIFTAATPDYANPVIDIIDCERRIRGRFFRDYCTVWNGCYIKDLDIFDRESKDIVIIDNTPVSYYLQPHNAIPISTWHDNRGDRELVQLLPFLRTLSTVYDVVPLLSERYPGNDLHSDISHKNAQYEQLYTLNDC
ncbi:RNA polymerase II carboxyterminal domain phosphatase [Babesia caballi]|uniref:RNA polymerase II carboxyterminal domain phosphatase n=1 Tax=Babesia caballi TaxID=5871 RepID=A0AAV4LRF1_BABCB|nr:RNA polymerase II carboxyterminal domain phosphatase [Babesia caballi]